MKHTPVLVREVLQFLDPQPGDTLLDATVGHGGHAQAYLEAAPNTCVIGIDADATALEYSRKQLAPYGDRVQLAEGAFANLADLVDGRKFTHVLFDLGVGSHQLADKTRGFSFRSDAPLSMRYASGHLGNMMLPPSQHQAVAWLESKLGHTPDADELVSRLREEELADVIWKYGQERFSRRIAKAIKQAGVIETARQLADIVVAAVPASYERGRIHPATRTFQALRIAVNRELESLETALIQASTMLTESGLPSRKGKLAVISFHSLEDRLVKNFLRSDTTLEVITKKPIQAGEGEQRANPRARSAKLRVAQKINNQKQTHDSKHLTTHYPSPPLQ